MPTRTSVLSATSTPADTRVALLIPTLDRIIDLLDRPHRLAHSGKAIHKLRVLTRRAQAATLILEPCLSAKTFDRLLNQLRKTRRAAGAIRDPDLIAQTLKAELARVPSRARTARKTKSSKPKKAEPPAFLADLKARERHAADQLHDRADRRRSKLKDARRAAKHDLGRASPSPDLAALARRVLAAQTTEINNLAGGDLSAPDRLHRLRRRLKLHRYTLELLQPVLPPSTIQEIARLKKLQDALGEWMDLHTALLELEPSTDPKARDNAQLRLVIRRREITARSRAIRALKAWRSPPPGPSSRPSARATTA